MKQALTTAEVFETSSAPEPEATASSFSVSGPTVFEMQARIAAFENEMAAKNRQLAKIERQLAKKEKENRVLQSANHNLVREITEMEQELFTDPLTGAFNRAGLCHVMNSFIDPDPSIERRYQPNNHVLMMIDLNGFKQTNDTHGHLAGDQALKTVAAALKDQTRSEGDLVARLGGDEFVVLFSNMSERGMHKKIADINKMFANLSFQWGVNDIPVRGSVGSWAIDYSLSTEQNIDQADQLMYRQKEMDKAGLDLVLV